MQCRKCDKQIDEDSAYCKYCGTSVVPKAQQRKKRGNGQGSVFRVSVNNYRAVAVIGWKETEVNGVKKRTEIKKTKQGFKSKSEALAYLPILFGNQEKPKMNLDKYYSLWSADEMLKLSKSQQTHFKTAYKRIKDIRYLDITKLTISHLRACIDGLTYYPAKDVKTLLSHLYKLAVAEQYVNVNLSQSISLPENNEEETVPFTPEEIERLWEDYKTHKETGYAIFMIYSGMMPGELFKCKKSMIDWDNQTIVGCGIKTKKRKTVPIIFPDIVVPVLADLCLLSDNEYLLKMDADSYRALFKEMIKRSGCNPRIVPYSCRHTTATTYSLANVEPQMLKEVMRHVKFSTTQRYIHIDTKPMLDAINRVLNAPLGAPEKD